MVLNEIIIGNEVENTDKLNDRYRYGFELGFVLLTLN